MEAAISNGGTAMSGMTATVRTTHLELRVAQSALASAAAVVTIAVLTAILLAVVVAGLAATPVPVGAAGVTPQPGPIVVAPVVAAPAAAPWMPLQPDAPLR
jgi:hypothetical protein